MACENIKYIIKSCFEVWSKSTCTSLDLLLTGGRHLLILILS